MTSGQVSLGSDTKGHGGWTLLWVTVVEEERLYLFGTSILFKLASKYCYYLTHHIISLENNIGLRYKFVDSEFPHCQHQVLGMQKKKQRGIKEVKNVERQGRKGRKFST